MITVIATSKLYELSGFSLAIMFGFQMEIFTLEEDSGDTGVVFGKVNNDMTELTLDVIIDFDLRSAGLLEGH